MTQTTPTTKSTPCPICKAPANVGNAAYPFCSMRCKKIDLGRWFGEDYTISRPIEQADLEESE